MNNLEPEILSDRQLYALFQNRGFAKDLKLIVENEFKRRALRLEQINVLKQEFDKRHPVDDTPMTTLDRAIVVAFPFVLPVDIFLANRHLSKNSKRRWQQHWNSVTLGLALWAIASIFVGWLVNNTGSHP